jgi:hypothetical protein
MTVPPAVQPGGDRNVNGELSIVNGEVAAPSESPIVNRHFLTDWLLPFLLLLPILWAYVPDGLPLTADSRVHFIRSAEMVHAWADGVLLPRWSANLGVGLGIPLFNYAPPLPYLTTAALHTLGLPLEAAFKTMHVLALLIFAYGAYWVVRAPLGQWAGLVGAAAMLYAPIVLRELFVQGNIGQLSAWAFVPWTLWGVQQVFARPGWRSGVALALAFAGATLSHNAVALLLAEIVAVQVLWLALWLRAGRALWVAGSALAGSLLLTAWFWAPALLEGDFIQLDRIAASSYAQRFLSLGELVAFAPRLDLRALNPYFPLTLGAVQVALAVIGVIAFIATGLLTQRRKGAKGSGGEGRQLHNSQFTIHNSQFTILPPWPTLRPILAGFYTLLALFGALMALPVSRPLWELLPFMDLLEFPSRWHGFTLVALGWLGGFAVFALAMWRPRVTPFAASAATALLLLAAVVNLYPDKQAPGAWRWTPADVVAYEVRSGAVGTTSLGEFNPVWAEAPIGATSPFRDDYPPDHQPDRLPATLPAGVTAMQIAAATQRHEFQISTPTAVSLTLDLLYFPGWQATGAGLSPQPVTGLALLHVPAGADQRVTFIYAGTPLERAAGWLSLLTWIGLFGLVGWRVLASRKGAKPQSFDVGGSTKTAARSAEPPLARSAELTSKPRLSPLLAASLLVAAVLVMRAAAPGWFRTSSPPGVAAAAAVAVDAEFGAAVRVIGVDPPPTQIQPGELLDATVYLEAAASPSQDYGLFLHLDRPDGVTVAAVDVLHPDEIPMRTWPAGFYVRAPLRLAVPPDALPIRYALHLGVPDPANGRWLPLENGETLLHLGDVWVEPATPAPAGAALATFGEQIELLAADVAEDGDLHLRWRATAQVEDELTMFVHYLDAAGRLLGQADGAPYGNLYPPAAWRPHQVVEDVRALPAGVDPAQVAAVQVGLYAPLTGERLPARTEDGAMLADNAYVVR